MEEEEGMAEDAWGGGGGARLLVCWGAHDGVALLRGGCAAARLPQRLG